jgi:hypothetical protein
MSKNYKLGICIKCNKKDVYCDKEKICLRCLRKPDHKSEKPVKTATKRIKTTTRDEDSDVFRFQCPENPTEIDLYWGAVSHLMMKKLNRPKSFKRLIKLRGNKCSLCGSRNGLMFHHTTEIKNSEIGNLKTFKEMEKEARLCILVCYECHKQIHKNGGENEK